MMVLVGGQAEQNWTESIISLMQTVFRALEPVWLSLDEISSRKIISAQGTDSRASLVPALPEEEAEALCQ